jgi:asparagine synthase (glutamine-hydrolysing)
MCGIAGFVGWRGDRETNERLLERMCGAIAHRGPDDEGHFVAPGVALGMRRLSIIDVAGGMQPIANERGDVTVVFNGEIYNHHSLRARLLANGHVFATRSDTETIVHLYEDSGPDCVRDLNGMFGIALWDARRQSLFVARDRLGIKPLYYWVTADGGLAFVSELRSLLALDRFPREIDRLAVARYLALGYVPDPLSIFRGVRKLPPGHYLTWDARSGVRVQRYWTPVRPEDSSLDENDAVAELQRRLLGAVGSHLESEVPLGAFLSGGIDSSTVVACMARQMDRPVQTFSIGFEEPEFNEAPDAAIVAAALGTEHTELIVRPDAERLIEDVARIFDEPFADSSALPTLLVSQLARRQVTVSLSGDGGDELFGGYARYLEMSRRIELRPTAVRRAVGAVARRLPFATPGRNRLLDLARERHGRYTTTMAAPLAPDEGGFARPDLMADAGDFEDLLRPYFDEADGRDFATQMMLADISSYLPGDILTKVDRTTMATSLEARVPLLDHGLVEFAVSVPSRLKMRDGTGKWLLRRAIQDLVPSHVLRKAKKGFSLPLGRWFREELRHRVEALHRPDARVNAYVDPGSVRRIADEHLSGRRDQSGLIWRFMMLELWLAFLDSGDLAQPSLTDSGLAASAS